MRVTTHLQAVMIVADSKHSLQITGNGDVLEPHDGIIGEVLLHIEPFTCLKSRLNMLLMSPLVLAQQLDPAGRTPALHRERCGMLTAWMQRQ